jgi:hypothetical protein
MQPISLKSLSEPDAAVKPARRIGIVIAHLGSGEAQKAAVVLASGLADRGYCGDLLMWHAGGFSLKDVFGQPEAALHPKINSCTLNRFPASVQTRLGSQPAARASS